jgi:hypothetical protein
MKKTMVILMVILSLFISAPAAKGTSLERSLVPAETDWLIHFDMEKYTSTRFSDLVMKEEGTSKIRKKHQRFARIYKVDLMKDIKGITVYGQGTGKKKAVVCLRGEFDRDHLLGLLKEETTFDEIAHGKFTIYKWNSRQFGTFASDQLVLLSSNEEAIKSALDVISNKKENITSSPLMSQISEIPSEAFLMAAVKNISSMAKNKPVILRKMKRAAFSITEMEQNLAFMLNIDVETPEDARRMEQIITGLLAMAKMQLEEKGKELKLPEDLKATVQDNRVRIDLAYPAVNFMEIILGKRKIPQLFIPGEMDSLT